jgi:hypothetical protein
MTVHDNAAEAHKYRLIQAEQIIREVMGADVYTSAGYLAEPHPDDPEHQPLYVDPIVCPRCGSLVHDKQRHTVWHTQLEARR